MPEKNLVKNLGPLAPLVGVWEGAQGDDIAPSDDRGTENNKYRERMVFEPFGPQTNHEQILYGLRYSTTAWRLGEPEPFHEDIGYWIWDVQDKQITKTFVIPRGIAVLAGGTVEPDSKMFTIQASEGSRNYGFCHNLFLEKEFKIVGFKLTLNIPDSKSFSYEQTTTLKIKGRTDLFQHVDKNVLNRVK